MFSHIKREDILRFRHPYSDGKGCTSKALTSIGKESSFPVLFVSRSRSVNKTLFTGSAMCVAKRIVWKQDSDQCTGVNRFSLRSFIYDEPTGLIWTLKDNDFPSSSTNHRGRCLPTQTPRTYCRTICHFNI